MRIYIDGHVGVPPAPPVYKAPTRDRGTGEQHPFKAVLDKAIQNKGK